VLIEHETIAFDIMGEELNFFIVNAATSDGMHFMTADELNYFGT